MRIFAVFIIFFTLFSCARQGTPDGGPKDEIPPKFMGSSPDTLSLNVDPNIQEINIDFDEYVILKNHTQQIIVSPPLGSSATFMPVGTPRKSVKITLNEPLLENTTYNINFGNALQDNNEGNKLPNFQYVFSTGDYIDSLEIKGKANVLSLKERPENLIVALFKIDSAYTDSAIISKKPLYISRPDSAGIFRLNYLHSGKYQMVAFQDEVENMQFDFGKEKFGFIEQSVELNENQEINIQLFNQLPSYKADKADQKSYGHLVFRFSGQPEEVEVKPLDFEFSTSKISYIPRSDSLNFWFNPVTDTIEEKSKRINFLVKHLEQTDTISLVYSNSMRHLLTLSENSKGGFTPAKKLKITANYPLEKLDSGFISVKKDSLNLSFDIEKDPRNGNAFTLDFPIELNSNYKVELLPGAIMDFFGEMNDTVKIDFKTKTRNDYGNVKLTLEGKPEKPFWIQLLTDKDEVLDEKYSTESYFEYNYLTPGKYYFKILIDENENEFWDTGDFFTKKQPEPVLTYSGYVNVRALWDVEETWIIQETNFDSEKDKSPSESEEDLP